MIETGRIDLFNLVYLRNKHCASVRTLSSRRDEVHSTVDLTSASSSYLCFELSNLSA